MIAGVCLGLLAGTGALLVVAGFPLRRAPSLDARVLPYLAPAPTRRTRELLRRYDDSAEPAANVPAAVGDLTPREREIFDLAARGFSNSEIAQHEFVSEATVKTHVSRVLAKLGLRDRVRLVVFAHEHGLVTKD